MLEHKPSKYWGYWSTEYSLNIRKVLAVFFEYIREHKLALLW